MPPPCRSSTTSSSGPQTAACGLFPHSTDTIATGLLLRSIGYRGRPVPDMSFEDEAGIILNDAGRIDGAGAYVVG